MYLPARNEKKSAGVVRGTLLAGYLRPWPPP